MLSFSGRSTRPRGLVCVLVVLALCASRALAGQTVGTVRVEVRHDGVVVADADVVVNGASFKTDADGVVSLSRPPGSVNITVVKESFLPTTVSITVVASQTQPVIVELQRQPTVEEQVTEKDSTRTQQLSLMNSIKANWVQEFIWQKKQ